MNIYFLQNEKTLPTEKEKELYDVTDLGERFMSPL